MEVAKLIRKAREKGELPLQRRNPRNCSVNYGLPVVDECIATSLDEAVIEAEAAGFPVVVKGLGARLTHKTERGLVKLNLKSADEVRIAAGEIAAGCG